ncbi:hypothetical protein Bca4012_092955 [Brassica carinata]|uniref:Amine oxidase n=2 Tax=Brassica oleracea TaxID=3712 RepID=A0A0D3DL81_BRAOL|nr:unnamed protein product [Brassica oleracea]
MAPLHLNIIIFFSFIFATLSSSFAPSRHPFDPLTETELELKLIQNIINKTYPISPSHKFTFQYVGLNEPDKSLVLSWYSSPKQHQTATTHRLGQDPRRQWLPMLTNDEQEAATELVLKFKPYNDESEAETERVIKMMPFYIDGTVNMYLIVPMFLFVTEFKYRLTVTVTMQEKKTVTMPKANGTEYRISELEPLFTRRFEPLFCSRKVQDSR